MIASHKCRANSMHRQLTCRTWVVGRPLNTLHPRHAMRSILRICIPLNKRCDDQRAEDRDKTWCIRDGGHLLASSRRRALLPIPMVRCSRNTLFSPVPAVFKSKPSRPWISSLCRTRCPRCAPRLSRPRFRLTLELQLLAWLSESLRQTTLMSSGN